MDHWLEFNRKYADKWSNILSKKSPLPNAEAENGRMGKAAEVSLNPGQREDVA